MKRFSVWWMLVTLLAAASPPRPSWAAAGTLEPARGAPWYDAERDSLRRVDVTPQDQFDERPSRWTANTAGRPPVNWPTWVLTVFKWIMIVGSIALVMWIVYLLTRELTTLDPSSLSAHASGANNSVASADHIRFESLPFQLKRPTSNLIDEARRHFETGDFKHACIYLYSYLLVELDRNQIIRLAKGKTNRQYLREARRYPPIHSIQRFCMIAFEDVYFGEQEIGRERCEECFRQVEAFQRALETVAA